VQDDPAGEATEPLSKLIRNARINEETPGSGQERRSSEVLTQVLEGPGVGVESHEPLPGRQWLIARIEGWEQLAIRFLG
jgi:hypothetical protein